jgi:Leucine-rich repeat (LRR) protein
MDSTKNNYDTAVERIQDCLKENQTTLYLSHLRLEHLPPEISALSSLKSLYMVDILGNFGGAQHYSLPPALEYLNIDSATFANLAPVLHAPLRHIALELRDHADAALDAMSAFATLEQITLDAHGNAVIIPESIQHIRGLTYLSINNAASVQLPEMPENLDRLNCLSVSGHFGRANKGQRLGEFIMPQTLLLQSLKTLRVNNLAMPHPFALENLRGLKNLSLNIGVAPSPSLFSKLSDLEEITLTTDDINSALDAIANPAALKRLTFCDHTTQALSESIGALCSLEKLTINSNSLQTLPEAFGKLSSLEYFMMSYSAIRRLPASFGALSALICLKTDGSALEYVPTSIGRLKNLMTFSATETKLKKLPASIGKLTALEYLDLSATPLSTFPATLANCKGLSVNRAWLRTINGTSRVIAFLAKKCRFIVRLQKSFYDYVYQRLDAHQKKLDVCGWHSIDDKAACRRYYDQCCGAGDRCAYLSETGCAAKSICCKFWLCEKALEYIASIMTDAAHPQRKLCAKYLKLRERYDILCRAFAIPLKGRCSKDDAFNARDKKTMNIYTDRWYNNILLRPRGLFVSAADAATEQSVPFFKKTIDNEHN